jgi:hypothetical protein
MMERQWFSARRFVFVLLLLLGFVALVSATSELPLLPPVDVAQSGRVRLATASAPTQVELLMIRLIRTFFGDQVKWSPFSRSDHLLQKHHHRIVREHRSHHPNLHDELAKRRLHLRGKPVSTSPTSEASKPSQQ